MRLAATLLLITALPVCTAQEIRLGDDRPASKKNHVTFLTDALEIPAGKLTTVDLRFRVDPDFHINSHTPKDETLIPTKLNVDSAGIKILSETYPAGKPFHLQIGVGQTLDVYQGEFRITLRISAPKGTSDLLGSLRYQACDNAACFPPKTLPISIAITAR